jgi:putative membrane protein
MLNRYYPHALAAVFTAFFLVLAINTVSRQIWIAEVIPVMIVFALLVVTCPKFRFSNLSYSLMAFWLFWHHRRPLHLRQSAVRQGLRPVRLRA